MSEVIFDLEADGLLDTVTKIHCLSYHNTHANETRTLYTKEDIESLFAQEGLVFIGHYITGYDFKALGKIYGIKRPKYYIDTLGLSWYLSPERAEHGLESYGVTYGVPKPPVADWVNDTIEVYTHRCETDVEINRRLWLDQKRKLQEIYT